MMQNDAGTAGSGGTTAGSGGADAGPPGPPSPHWKAYAARSADARWGVPLAYSTKDKTFIGFSGSKYPSTGTADTFALSMATGTWTKIADTNPPTASYCSCTTYLPDQDQVLLFGGLSSAGPLPPSAWTLDVASGTWTAISGSVPAVGIGCATVWMPELKKAVIFSGLGQGGFSSGTWTYDPVARSLTQLTPATSPPARADSIAAYDPGDGGRMLVFAGTQDEQTSAKHRNDLWAFDGTTWTQLETTGGPPPGRRVPAGGFDPVRRRWVVFGGTLETKDFGDLWVLDVPTLTWTELPIDGAPPARGFASAGYDPGTDSYFVVGGLQQPSDKSLDDGWQLTLE